MKKKVIIISIVLVIILAVIGSLIAFSNHEVRSLHEIGEDVEALYNENKVTLNEFVKLCIEDNIVYIGRDPYTDKYDEKYIIIGSTYVFTNNDLSDEEIKIIEDTLDLLKKCNLETINIYNSEKFKYNGVSFTFNGEYIRTGLTYLIEKIDAEIIKKDNFSEDVWYVDDNWYVEIYG